MTEQDWLASNDPREMFDWIASPGRSSETPDGGKLCAIQLVSDRKLRLFAVACVRRMWHTFTDDRSCRAVVMAERYADGSVIDLAPYREAAGKVWKLGDDTRPEANITAEMMAEECCHTSAYHAAHFMVRDRVLPDKPTVAAILRDIAGNPFHPLKLSRNGRLTSLVRAAKQTVQGCCSRHADMLPCDCLERSGNLLECWLTPTVQGLARAAYDSRGDDGVIDPSTLFVLSDALEEAGCNDAGVLNHLRLSGPHVRGCHLLDVLLDLS
jgi:hypothetical protein